MWLSGLDAKIAPICLRDVQFEQSETLEERRLCQQPLPAKLRQLHFAFKHARSRLLAAAMTGPDKATER